MLNCVTSTKNANTDDRAEEYINATETSDKGLGRNASSENRLSAGWSTMDSQYRSCFPLFLHRLFAGLEWSI